MHLFEIHDCSWCPIWLRNGLTDFLTVSIDTFDAYGPIRHKLLAAMAESQAVRVVDLCSGGGGPWINWSRTLSDLPPIVLTDKFPNLKADISGTRPNITYCNESVDARTVPIHLTGFRTMFTAAHHFRPETIRQVIRDAVCNRQPIGIFEFTHRSFKGLTFMLFSFVGVWLLTPKMKRITWDKLLFTYVAPLIPLVTTFDGLVSCLRTYTPDELSSMANAPGYEWRAGTEAGRTVPVTYLIGIPKST